jgi:hypothetical protein
MRWGRPEYVGGTTAADADEITTGLKNLDYRVGNSLVYYLTTLLMAGKQREVMQSRLPEHSL